MIEASISQQGGSVDKVAILELIDQQGQMKEADIVKMERTHNRQAGTINELARLYRAGTLTRERAKVDDESVTWVSRPVSEGGD